MEQQAPTTTILPEPVRFSKQEYEKLVNMYPHIEENLKEPFLSAEKKKIDLIQKTERGVLIYIDLISEEQKDAISEEAFRKIKGHRPKRRPWVQKFVAPGLLMLAVLVVMWNNDARAAFWNMVQQWFAKPTPAPIATPTPMPTATPVPTAEPTPTLRIRQIMVKDAKGAVIPLSKNVYLVKPGENIEIVPDVQGLSHHGALVTYSCVAGKISPQGRYAVPNLPGRRDIITIKVTDKSGVILEQTALTIKIRESY